MASNMIKTQEEIELIREACKIHARVVEHMYEYIKPGISTYDIDQFHRGLCSDFNVIPAELGYQGYPATICVGINNDGIHCIPSKNKVLKEGDIVNLDTVVKKNGYHADGGFTIGVGEIDKEAKRLINTTKMALEAAIHASREGYTTKDVGEAIYGVTQLAGYDVLKRFAAHGVGKEMHEAPNIPNYPYGIRPVPLKAGMVLALDTMLTEGIGEVEFLDDDWSTKTIDGKRFSFYEHTVLVSKKGAEVLTRNKYY